MQSNHDGESLGAGRGAARILAKHDLTWGAVLHEMEARIRKEILAHRPTVSEALAELLRVLKPSDFRNLIVQFATRWNQTGALSEKQRQVIRNAMAKNSIHPDWSVTDFMD
jgi:hypothetical protein